jgi:hypothetical protein
VTDAPDGSPEPRSAPDAQSPLVFRLPRSAYLAVLFLLFCVTPLALASSGGDQSAVVGPTWRLILLAIPVIAAIFIARTRTVVDDRGFRVRAAFASTTLPWERLQGLSITGRAIYAVDREGGALRLPCVRVPDLAAIAQASGGRLPEIPEAPRKYAPGRRPRRRVARR